MANEKVEPLTEEQRAIMTKRRKIVHSDLGYLHKQLDVIQEEMRVLYAEDERLWEALYGR
jgi:hypothetical protein